MSVGTFALFSSCGSDDNNNTPTKPTIANGCKITKMSLTHGVEVENINIVYDNDNIKSFLVTSSSGGGNHENYSINVIYQDNSNLVKEMQYSFGYKDVFTYNDKGQIIEAKIFDENNKLVDNYFYEYNSNGELIKESYHYDYGLVGTLAYEWSGANCIKIDDVWTSQNNENTGQTLLEYSSIANEMPKYVFRLLSFFSNILDNSMFMSKNLISKKSFSQVDYFSIYNYTYTLTDKGLIDTIKGTKSDSDYNFEYRFEYSCQ